MESAEEKTIENKMANSTKLKKTLHQRKSPDEKEIASKQDEPVKDKFEDTALERNRPEAEVQEYQRHPDRRQVDPPKDQVETQEQAHDKNQEKTQEETTGQSNDHIHKDKSLLPGPETDKHRVHRRIFRHLHRLPIISPSEAISKASKTTSAMTQQEAISSLYEKFTNALIPPFSASFSSLYSNPVSESEDSDDVKDDELDDNNEYKKSTANVDAESTNSDLPSDSVSVGKCASNSTTNTNADSSKPASTTSSTTIKGADGIQRADDYSKVINKHHEQPSSSSTTTHKSDKQHLEPESEGEEDDADVATGVQRSPAYLLNLVAGSYMYSGLDSLTKLIKSYDDPEIRSHVRSQFRAQLRAQLSNRLPLSVKKMASGYGVFDSEDESNSEDNARSSEDEEVQEHRHHALLAQQHLEASSSHSSGITISLKSAKSLEQPDVTEPAVSMSDLVETIAPGSVLEDDFSNIATASVPTPTPTTSTVTSTETNSETTDSYVATATNASIDSTSTTGSVNINSASASFPSNIKSGDKPVDIDDRHLPQAASSSDDAGHSSTIYISQSETEHSDAGTLATFRTAEDPSSVEERSSTEETRLKTVEEAATVTPSVRTSAVNTPDSGSFLSGDYHRAHGDENFISSNSTLDSQPKTTFQQSILDNLNPQLIKEGLLVRLKEGHQSEASEEYRTDRLRLSIADKLQRVFDISDDDYFYGNYSAWLIRDVLLQGHLYLTRDSILFFAFLPKRYSVTSESDSNYDDSNNVVQSGTLGLKTGKYGDSMFTTVLTHRYWAVLRSETLCIYSSSTNLYFPKVVIDLKTCIRAEIADKDKTEIVRGSSPPRTPRAGSGTATHSPISRRESGDNSTDEEIEISNILAQESIGVSEDNFENVSTGVWIKLFTKKKNYKFFCDSLFSARQWCNNITKLIFQLNNSNAGNEVLLKIPIADIVDYEKNKLFEEESKDSNVPEDEIPVSMSFSYKKEDQDSKTANKSELRKKLIAFDMSKKRSSSSASLNSDGQSTVDRIFFMFFRDGHSFYESLNAVILDQKVRSSEQSEASDSSDKFFEKAKKKMYKKSHNHHHDTDTPRKLSRSISTLSTSDHSNTIVNRVISKNLHVFSPPDDSSGGPHRFGIESPHPILSPTSSTNRIKKLGRSLSNPAKLLTSSRRSSEDSVISERSLQESDFFSNPEIYVNNKQLNFPRPLTISGLKSMQMSFETSQKDPNKAESEFSKNEVKDYIDDEAAKSGSELNQPGLQRPIAFPTPLNLRDPSEYNDESKRQNKLMAIGKSIKAFSKVGSKWSAFPAHFADKNGVEDQFFVQNQEIRELTERHYQEHFSLNKEKKLVATYYAHLQRSIPVYGKVYLGDSDICFRSLLPGVQTTMILPLSEVVNCYREKGLKLTYSGLIIAVNGQSELFLEFSSQKSRDDCESMILAQLEKLHGGETWAPSPHQWGSNYEVELTKSRLMTGVEDHPLEFSFSEQDLKRARTRIENARIKMFEDKFNAAAGLDVPIILEDSPLFKTEIKPSTSYNFTLLTIGSRGDVQPFIALGKGLMKEGHNVTIATHAEFEDWILKHGMKFKVVSGNPAELMSLMVTHGSMSVGFLKEASSKFRGWINELLTSSWQACQGADILIESPAAMAGVHIAEALGIPYLRAFTMPWTRTRAYPHAFIVPDQKKGGSYNYLTHVMFETVFWRGISGQINKWRVKELGLPSTNLFRLQSTKIPFMYNVSPTIFPPAVDFPDWVKVTGYWFLDEGAAADYNPPEELIEFMELSNEEGKKIVYIGFGSIVVKDANSLTRAIVEAVLDADVRCILNKGWSDRLSKDQSEPVELPPEIYDSGAIPHDWLFPRIDAAVHHGGSGTTGAALRCGLPTIIKPFFGDQFFYASRVEEIGVGVGLKNLNARSLSKAITKVISDLKLIEKSKKVAEKMKRENGVMTAIETIYSELEYARNLILSKQQHNENYRLHMGTPSGVQSPNVEEDEEYTDTEKEEDEEDYTDESDDEEGESYEAHEDNFSINNNTEIEIQRKSVPSGSTDEEDLASVAESNLGETIASEFHFN